MKHETLDRRAALKLFAGGLALPLAACGKPHEEIVPYVEMPERLVPGEPLKFATTLPLSGFGRGVLAVSLDGRPIKIEGNPRHPASLGATDVFAEAEIMQLYDPGRSKAPRHGNDIASWTAFADALRGQLDKARARRGRGLRVVTGPLTSPTLLRQIAQLLGQYPEARWCAHDPLPEDHVLAGSAMAFARPLTALPRIADAAVMLTLDADPLGAGPRQIADARAFAQRRERGSDPFMRLYAVEPDWSLTGANADHRLALHPDLLRHFALAVAAYMNGEAAPNLPEAAALFAQACAADLKSNNGRALILVGPRQPAEIHALAHWLNAQINAPVDFIAPVGLAQPDGGRQSLQDLADDLDGGRVETLIVIDANPAYDAPADLDLARKIGKVPFAAHLGLHDNETGTLCAWHLPLSHALESWSDLRAFEGTASIVQPLIRPLYDTRSAHDLLALIGGATAPSAYDLVRQTWRDQAQGDFETWWRRALHDGVIANSAAPRVPAGAPRRPELAPVSQPGKLTVLFAPDPSVWDGTFADNAWLQECPHPFTKDVWGNSFHISPADARDSGIADGEIVTLSHGNSSLRGPARIRDGQADGVVSITLGHGRSGAGAIGHGIGINAYRMRTADALWRRDGVTLTGTGEKRPPPSTQEQFRLEGEARELYPTFTLAELAKGARPKDREESRATLYPPFDYDTYAWAMVIDTSLCIGCNACVVACQAENNVPVVGPEEIARGRDMHWLRIDRYVPEENAPPGFQPVPCMHCEHAPCEPVCPVAASVHDGEGLNVQVYNRCIGTRFCQANCPYKVRRFNWFGYADGQEYADLGAAPVKAANNPDVTVRQRGVMEKCTYCVQRISRARREAEKEDRPIAEGEVVTACQSACPTRAISFGDKNNKKSRINSLREEPHHYALLGHLGTRPRTTYLGRLRNPNPALQGKPA